MGEKEEGLAASAEGKLEQEWFSKPKVLKRYFYVESESAFGMNLPLKLDSGDCVLPFKKIQRALGRVEGVLKSLDRDSMEGEIEVEGRVFPCRLQKRKLRRKHGFGPVIGSKRCFHFWPTLQEKSFEAPSAGESFSFSSLSLSSVGSEVSVEPFQGYIEAVGKLARIWEGGFEIWIWAKPVEHHVRVPFASDYPYPDELGSYVWVVGRFEASTGLIRFEEASSIAFLSEEEEGPVVELWKQRKEERRREREERARKKKESSSAGEGDSKAGS